jgi:hypothetical protein
MINLQYGLNLQPDDVSVLGKTVLGSARVQSEAGHRRRRPSPVFFETGAAARHCLTTHEFRFGFISKRVYGASFFAKKFSVGLQWPCA